VRDENATAHTLSGIRIRTFCSVVLSARLTQSQMTRAESVACRGAESVACRGEESVACRGEESVACRGEESVACRGEESAGYRGAVSFTVSADIPVHFPASI
jgi:hypothetical protein